MHVHFILLKKMHFHPSSLSRVQHCALGLLQCHSLIANKRSGEPKQRLRRFTTCPLLFQKRCREAQTPERSPRNLRRALLQTLSMNIFSHPTLQLLASKTAYYIICVRQDDLFKDSGKRGGNSFLAKLRATSVAHTEYALYDR